MNLTSSEDPAAMISLGEVHVHVIPREPLKNLPASVPGANNGNKQPLLRMDTYFFPF